MKKIICIICTLVFMLTGCNTYSVTEEDITRAEKFIESQRDTAFSPCRKADGSRYTIGIVDIDPYYPSGEMLYYVVDELINEGWIDSNLEIPFDPLKTDVKEFVNYLASVDTGDYIRFSSEANYYIAIDGEEKCADSLNSLIEDEKVDIIIALGTLSGEFSEDAVKGRIPVLIYFSIDPVGAGLINDGNYSTVENVWAHISLEGYERQLKYYKKIYDFKNIGMIYYDESVAAMNVYRSAAEEEGIKISERKIERIDTSSEEKKSIYYENLKRTVNDLVENEKIDAFMINTDIIVDGNVTSELCDRLYEKGIPVFVQTGEEFVQNGAFMTLITMDAQQQAPFFVNALTGILSGKGTDEMPQKYLSASFPIINMTAAERLGFKVPGEILEYAKKIYY